MTRRQRLKLADKLTPAAGDDIRAARAALGLTQAQLAERIGIPQPVLAMWESGTRRCPPARCEAIAALLRE